MKEDLLKIINNYGIMKQLKYFQSEVFELNEAIICCENDECNYYDEVFKNNKRHITEEIADCYVMLEQFRHYYGINEEDIKKVMREKIDRQLLRIKKEEKNE